MKGTIRQLLNTLGQIHRAESTGFVRGVSRHLNWIVRRLSHNFPTTLPLSESCLHVEFHSGVHALVNCLGLYDYNNMTLVKLLLSHVHPAVFFDVGANVGAYTLVASEVSSAQVVSFEPHPRPFSCLEKNVRMNNRTNVLLFPAAISDARGVVTFTNAPEISINKIADSGSPGTIPVNARTLDDICAELHLVPTVVKIDVEGHELKVLNGFRNSLPKVNVLVIEHGDESNIVSLMKPLGFEGPFYFHASSLTFRTYPQRRAEDPVFVKQEFLGSLQMFGAKLKAGRGLVGGTKH